MFYDSKYIETDAFLMACEEDRLRLDEHLDQFDNDELRRLRSASLYLDKACAAKLSNRMAEGVA